MANDNVTPLRVEKGKALDAYKKASVRLARAALPQMGDMRKLRNAGADVYIRQAEIAAMAQLLIDLKLVTTDQWLMRCADALNDTSKRVEGMNTAIHLPGR